MLSSWLGKTSRECQEALRQSIRPRAPYGSALESYLRHPQPSLSDVIKNQKFVALDFEMSGLEAKHDKILSIGLVHLDCDEITLSSSHEIYLDRGKYVNKESAVINEIVPKKLNNATKPKAALDQLLTHLEGKVVVAHSACLERNFLNAQIKETYGIDRLPCHFIDTIQLEKRYSYAGLSKSHASYQLNDLRHHYNLPAYYEHSAASDALACAELFLVQLRKLKLKSESKIVDVVI